MARIGITVLLLFCAGAPLRAWACASCGCGDQTLTATGVEQPYRNRVRLTLEERYGSLSQGAADGATGSYFLRSTVAASWTPHKRVTLALMLPWVTSFQRDHGQASTVNGLGDLEISARVVVWRDRGFAPHHLLWAVGGLKLPTGWRVYDAAGYPFPDDEQPSSQSWDPFTGLTYGWFSGNLLSVFVSGSYRYTTPGPRGYTRGMSVGGSAALQVQPFRWGALQLGADLLWSHPDTLPNGAPSPNSGGTVLFIAPGLLFTPVTDLLIRATVDVPAVSALNGVQTVGTQAMLSVAYDIR